MPEVDFNIVKVGPLRLFRALIDEINLVDTINNSVTWDRKQCKISPGELIVALMLGIFGGRRALYTLHEYYEDQDLELIFGRRNLVPEDFNDDCLGRALDRLADCRFTRLFGTAVLNARRVHDFTVEACHADTTSVSVYGEYDREDYPWRETLAIAYGHSKARRPDLKQFKLGLCTTSEGIPLGGEPLDGNLDDKTWSRLFLEGLDEIETIVEETILVIDSAAMNGHCLDLIREKRLRLISRLPETFNLCGELKEKALRDNDWRAVTFSADEKKNERYKVRDYERDLAGGTYRFVTVRSESLAKTKQKSIETAAAKEQAALKKYFAALGKKRFTTREEAEKAWREFLDEKEPRFHLVSCRFEEAEEARRRGKRGRPAKDEAPVYERFYVLVASAERDEARIEHAKKLAGIFVLFCSAPGLGPSEILKHYKDRAYIENRFRFLKDPFFAGAIFLKKPERVKALGYVMILALLIYSLFERRIRRGLLAENEPYHVAGSYRTFTPRGETVLEALQNITIARFERPNGVLRQVPTNLRDKTRRVIRLAGFDVDIYTKPAVCKSD